MNKKNIKRGLTSLQQEIINILPSTEENAITREELCNRFRMTDTKLRTIIGQIRDNNELKKSGYRIVSLNNAGYFITQGEEEKFKYRCTEYQRAITELRRADAPQELLDIVNDYKDKLFREHAIKYIDKMNEDSATEMAGDENVSTGN